MSRFIKTCAMIGHGPDKLPWGQDESSSDGLMFKFRLRESLDYLIGKGYVDFLSCGARGFDLIAAEIVLSLRETYPWIRLIMVCPWNGQADNWKTEDRERWQRILECSDQVVYISNQPDRRAFFRRNAYLTQNADVILAAYNGDPHSGTGLTIGYAKNRGVRVLKLALIRKAA